MVPYGYDRVVSGGQILYCRSEMITGSRLLKDICLTPAQLRDQQDKSRVATEQIQSASTRAGCTPSPTSLECR